MIAKCNPICLTNNPDDPLELKKIKNSKDHVKFLKLFFPPNIGKARNQGGNWAKNTVLIVSISA